MSCQNEGIVSTGSGNLQLSGKTNLKRGKVTVGAPTETKYNKPVEMRACSGQNNKGVISSGDGNAQTSGDTDLEGAEVKGGNVPNWKPVD